MIQPVPDPAEAVKGLYVFTGTERGGILSVPDNGRSFHLLIARPLLRAEGGLEDRETLLVFEIGVLHGAVIAVLQSLRLVSAEESICRREEAAQQQYCRGKRKRSGEKAGGKRKHSGEKAVSQRNDRYREKIRRQCGKEINAERKRFGEEKGDRVRSAVRVPGIGRL